MERLQKVMARAGVASRRKCEEMIVAGRVTVNGSLCKTLGTKVDPLHDKVKVDGKNVFPSNEKIYLMLNKPRGYVTTMKDPRGRKKVADLIGNVKTRVFPVGRLDINSEGLLLLTNDGGLAYRLTHPKFEVEKTYHVRLEGVPGVNGLTSLARGVRLEDGWTAPAKLRLLKVEKGDGLVSITIREGKNRQVRRMFEHIGYSVKYLKRVQFGSLRLEGLRKGEYRELTDRELAYLKNSSGLPGYKNG